MTGTELIDRINRWGAEKEIAVSALDLETNDDIYVSLFNTKVVKLDDVELIVIDTAIQLAADLKD